MSHREAYAVLGTAIHQQFGGRRRRPFHFLDLACGDAHHSTQCLQRLPPPTLVSYTGMDQSESALEYAQKSLQQLTHCSQKELLVGDFRGYEQILLRHEQQRENDDTTTTNASSSSSTAEHEEGKQQRMQQKPMELSFDVVWIGLSLHHLETSDRKRDFMKGVYNNLAPDGMLLIYEPITRVNNTSSSSSPEAKAAATTTTNDSTQTPTQITTRQQQTQKQREYSKHFEHVGDQLWSTILTPEEKTVLYDHVRDFDYPESEEQWLELGRQAGFSNVEQLFRDPHELYALFSYRK